MFGKPRFLAKLLKLFAQFVPSISHAVYKAWDETRTSRLEGSISPETTPQRLSKPLKGMVGAIGIEPMTPPV